MRLKSFHGPTLSDAMRLVRDALGDDAIIVSTRDDDAGGVRVTAAIDDAPVHRADLAEKVVPADSLVDHAAEIIENLAKALIPHQIRQSIMERLLATATQFAEDDPVIVLAAALDTHLSFEPWAEDQKNRISILIGPPGAGKTLCTAKWATKAIMARKPVSVISTDTERAGGMEQLASILRLLDIDLIEIEDPHALREAVMMQPPENLVMIDTPGLNPFDDVALTQIGSLIDAAGGGASLVLPANMDPSEAAEMIAAYRSVGAQRLILTHLDMTRRLGGVIQMAYDGKIPLSAFVATSKVAQAPAPLNPVALARMILPRSMADQMRPTGTDANFSQTERMER